MTYISLVVGWGGEGGRGLDADAGASHTSADRVTDAEETANTIFRF